MQYINSRSDFLRIVDGWLERFDMSFYTMSYDDFVANVTIDLLCLARSRGFKWGDETPKISNQELQEITNQYSIM